MERFGPPSWRQAINALLNGAEGFQIVFQPICALSDERAVVGYEALSRFPRIEALELHQQTPDVWFAEAARAGLGEELEALAVSCAVQAIPLVTPRYVSVNVSADTILVPDFASLVMGSMPEHIVVELTEHDVVRSLPALKAVLDLLRHGTHAPLVGVKSDERALARLAIDDVGAGHSGLKRIVELTPDVLKLDRSIVADVDTDTVKAALIAGMVIFAASTGMALVAEGIETEAEFDALRTLGVGYGQGWLLGRPAPMEGVEGSCRPSR